MLFNQPGPIRASSVNFGVYGGRSDSDIARRAAGTRGGLRPGLWKTPAEIKSGHSTSVLSRFGVRPRESDGARVGVSWIPFCAAVSGWTDQHVCRTLFMEEVLRKSRALLHLREEDAEETLPPEQAM